MVDQKDYSNEDAPGTLYPGTLLGYRHFRFRAATMTSRGPQFSLHSPTYPSGQPWGPSFQDAHCKKPSHTLGLFAAQVMPYEPPTNRLSVEAHTEDWAKCECGFYGSYDPDTRFYTQTGPRGPQMVGVVEAAGRISLGSTGFRAMKARLVAAALEDTAWTPYNPLWSSRPAAETDLINNTLPLATWDVGARAKFGHSEDGLPPGFRVTRDELLDLIRCDNPGVEIFATREELVAAYPQPSRDGLPVTVVSAAEKAREEAINIARQRLEYILMDLGSGMMREDSHNYLRDNYRVTATELDIPEDEQERVLTEAQREYEVARPKWLEQQRQTTLATARFGAPRDRGDSPELDKWDLANPQSDMTIGHPKDDPNDLFGP